MKIETRNGKWLTSALLLWLAFAPLAQAFYNPSTGKWLSRDPIVEKGGLNLHGFVGNNALSRIDPLGLNYIDDIFGNGTRAGFREKLQCYLGCPMAELLRKAAELMQQSIDETKKRFPNSDLHNDGADAWRHCYWSCEMYKATTPKCAYEIGKAHEDANARDGQPQPEIEMDSYNNSAGLSATGGLKTGDCAALCQAKLDRGQLKTLE